MTKKVWKSKVLWINILSVGAYVLDNLIGTNVIPPAKGVVVLGVINILLRFITDKPLDIPIGKK
jgi:hypothetical protein